MATYAIYKLIFERTQQKSIIESDDEKHSFDDAQELLQKILREPLPVSKMNKKKEQIPLECTLERENDKVNLLMLCNEKEMQFVERKEPKTQTIHPGCYVILDNRPGVAQVAIERDSSFDSKPDDVRDIIEAALNRKFEEYGLRVSINQKWKEGGFWTAVNEQCEVHHDRIKKVVFDFPNPEIVGPIDTGFGYNEKFELLNSFARNVNAAKGTLSLSSDKQRTIKFNQEIEDIANMVSLCSLNAYNIAVHFDSYGIYRNGTDFKAFSQVKDYIVDEFRSGQRVLGREDEADYLLVQWLDEVRNVTKDYKNDTKTRKKRKRVS